MASNSGTSYIGITSIVPFFSTYIIFAYYIVIKSPHRYTWICEIEKFRLGYLSKIISIANLMKVGDNSTLRSIGLSEKANSIMTF